jgi:hypothetical protein
MAQASPPIPAPTMMTFIYYFCVLLTALFADAGMECRSFEDLVDAPREMHRTKDDER